MKKPTNDYNASLALVVCGKLEDVVRERGGTHESLARLISENGDRLIKEYASMLLQDEFRNGTRRNFAIEVDYTMSIEEMVKAGKFEGGTGKEIISENYPVTGTGVVAMEVSLVCFYRNIKIEEVNDELNSMGLRPGMLPELLALAARYPDLQKVFCIVAPGARSTRDYGSCRLIPYLTQRGGGQGRSVRYVSHDFDYATWISPTYFLAVRQ